MANAHTRQHNNNTEESTREKMRQATGGYRVLSHLDDGLHLHMQLLDGVRE
jgi:hypothetical protein